MSASPASSARRFAGPVVLTALLAACQSAPNQSPQGGGTPEGSAATPAASPAPASPGSGSGASTEASAEASADNVRADIPDPLAQLPPERAAALTDPHVYLPGDGTITPSPVVVLLHGYGSNEQDLAPLRARIPESVAVIALQAPVNMGEGQYAWYYLEPDPEGGRRGDPAAIEAATEALAGRIRTVVAGRQLDPTHVHLLGFSQGGMMAHQLVATYPDLARSAALVGAREPRPTEFAPRTTPTPIFFVHGRVDNVVTLAAGQAMRERMTPDLFAVTEMLHEGGHSLPLLAVDAWRQWLEPQLPAATP